MAMRPAVIAQARGVSSKAYLEVGTGNAYRVRTQRDVSGRTLCLPATEVEAALVLGAFDHIVEDEAVAETSVLVGADTVGGEEPAGAAVQG
jgi:hypothetical protein